ncbi:MAG: phage tail protein [Terriglobia bacterium]
MSNASKNNYFFLNREGRWPEFKWSGLDLREDGSLELSSLPLLASVLPSTVKTAPTPSGPTGLAMDPTGTLYFSDPERNCVQRILGCDGAIVGASCMGGTNGQATHFKAPRGLLIPAGRSSLLVADSENHRIQVFDLNPFQLVEIWGQANPAAAPQPGSQPGELNTPWTLAGDSCGNTYVVDYGNRRIQKFNALGEVAPTFWNNIQASGLLHQPAEIAVWEPNATIQVLVVDTSPSPAIFVFDGEGRAVLDSHGQARRLTDNHLKRAMGIVAAGDSLYVADNSAERVFRFRIGDCFEYVGEAIGYNGPAAALLLDRRGGLWVHPGGSLSPVKLQTQQGSTTVGSLWSHMPLQVPDRQVTWHLLQALARPLALNAHLDLFAYASNDLAHPPKVDLSADNPFAGDPKWQSVPDAANLDVTELYIGGAKAKYLWVGALFSGDGTVSPVVRQLRVEFDYPSYAQYLPAVYRDNANCGEFLPRLLSLFQSLFGGVEHEINSLPILFDPKAAPKTFLAWLAGCLGLDLDDNWDQEQQRKIIAEIFHLSGWRGTAKGLREYLRLFAGVEAIIEEPILNAAWWSLPSAEGSCYPACASSSASSSPTWQDTQNSSLGWTTMLAPAQPQGAVVGTSAVLDQSQLITDEDFGAPLFTDISYQFSVQVYRSQVMCQNAVAGIKGVLDQEKPAHTSYHLCIIDPRFRVGFQSRLGIDTVVGGLPRSLTLGTDQALGQATVLAGANHSFLGVESTLGVNTRLG